MAAILSYHATLRPIRTNAGLLKRGELLTASGEKVTTGVNSKGLFVKGNANGEASSITASINKRRFVIYTIDTILLPFSPPEDLCS